MQYIHTHYSWPSQFIYDVAVHQCNHQNIFWIDLIWRQLQCIIRINESLASIMRAFVSWKDSQLVSMATGWLPLSPFVSDHELLRLQPSQTPEPKAAPRGTKGVATRSDTPTWWQRRCAQVTTGNWSGLKPSVNGCSLQSPPFLISPSSFVLLICSIGSILFL